MKIEEKIIEANYSLSDISRSELETILHALRHIAIYIIRMSCLYNSRMTDSEKTTVAKVEAVIKKITEGATSIH